MELGFTDLEVKFDSGYELLIHALINGEHVGHIEVAEIIDHDFNNMPINSWMIGNIFTIEEYRDQGIAKKLIERTEKLLSEKGVKMLLLSPDKTSVIPHHTLVNIYGNLGYEEYFEKDNYMFKYIN